MVPVSAGQRRLVSVYVHEGSGERGSRVVHDVVPGRTVRNRAFRRNRRLDRADVGFHRRLFGILRISGERQEPHRRENGENRDYDDELRERETAPESF